MKFSTAALSLLLALHLPLAFAQSACSSDGAPAPQALYERFLSADCAECWSDKAFMPTASTAVLDWIAPGKLDDDAPLSAAARTDTLTRLQALHRPPPAGTDVHVSQVVQRLPGRLRISFGPAVNDYVGVDASYLGPRLSGAEEWTLWLALVEQIPAAAEGTSVPRNLVKNLFQHKWNVRNQLSKRELFNLPQNTRWMERRAMQMALGTDPARLALIGWLENAQGQVVATASAQCIPGKP